MEELKGVYVIDKLENFDKWISLGVNFLAAAKFLSQGEFDVLPLGRHVVDGDAVYVNCDAAHYVLPQDSRLEFHRKYFDVHVPLTADEKIGLAPFACVGENDFDEEKDIGFIAQGSAVWRTVHRGEFCLIWPNTCLHAPAVTTDEPKDARKLVVKIRSI